MRLVPLSPWHAGARRGAAPALPQGVAVQLEVASHAHADDAVTPRVRA
ncbi:hypothetical protein [Cellulomonas telluris]|nr:hypothetical protein [Cellulomonas telluris]